MNEPPKRHSDSFDPSQFLDKAYSGKSASSQLTHHQSQQVQSLPRKLNLIFQQQTTTAPDPPRDATTVPPSNNNSNNIMNEPPKRHSDSFDPSQFLDKAYSGKSASSQLTHHQSQQVQSLPRKLNLIFRQQATFNAPSSPKDAKNDVKH